MELKTSNPAFAGKTFEGTATHLGYGRASAYGSSMTISGTVNKAGILMLCVLATAAWTWNQYFTTGNPASVGGYTMIGAFGGFIAAMVTIFKKEWSPVTAPVYALLEGLFLGSLSAMFEMRYPGIAIQSVALTFGTCFAMLLAYRSGLIRPTAKFTMGVVAATGGIAAVSRQYDPRFIPCADSRHLWRGTHRDSVQPGGCHHRGSEPDPRFRHD